MKLFRMIVPVAAIAFSANLALAQDPAPKPEPTPQPAPQEPPAPPPPTEESAPVADSTANDSVAVAGTLRACRSVGTSAANSENRNASRPDSAQPGNRGTAPGFTMVRLCRSLEGITLSDSQITRIEAVEVRFKDRLTAVQSEDGLTNDQRRVLGERDNEVRAILTAEQRTAFDRNITRIQPPVTTPRR